MRLKYGKFAIILLLALLYMPQHLYAQMLAAPGQQHSSQANAENMQQPKEENLLAPVKKNLNYNPQTMQEPQDDPQVFHFKIVNGKVSVDEPDNRSILVYYDNYRVVRGFDKLTKCNIRVYVINDLKEKINSLGFKLHWPEISTAVEMNQVKTGVKTYTDLLLVGEGCLRLDKTPTIEVNRCRVKGMSQEACADAIKWMPR
ncbi:MAG: hypothetical protein IJ099_06610 [Alphaproteobacteria bacterium]|nr:hypothetical protein [Alphaproteobacteria bacterium]